MAKAPELPATDEDLADEPVEEAAEDPVEETAEEPVEEAAEDPVDEAAEEEPESSGTRFFRDPMRMVAIALVVVAAVAAGFFGWSWYGAAHNGSLSFSKERDAVLRAGEQGVQNLNTLDYRKVDEGFSLWEDSSTGELHQELVQGRDQFETQVRQAKTVTTAKILDGAIVELDTHAGKASMIIAVQITVTPSSGAPATKQSRMRAQLARTSSGWKLSALGQAPLGTSG